MLRRIFPVLAVLAFLPATVQAQDWYEGVYLELRGGATFPQDQDDDDIEFSYEPGWLVEGAAGYGHDSGLRGEIALGYRQNDFDEVEAFGTSFTLNGDVSIFTAMVNLYYDIYLEKLGASGALADLTPFVGGGAGVAVWDAEVNSIGGVSVSSVDGDDEEFAYQAVGGLSYAFTENVSASIAYSYFSMLEDFGTDSDYSSHNVIFGLRYGF